MLWAAMVVFSALLVGLAIGLLARMIWVDRHAIIAALRGRWPLHPLSPAEEATMRDVIEQSEVARKIFGVRG